MTVDPARRSVRDQLLTGGTSLPADGGFPWLLVGVGAAAALAAVLWWVASAHSGERPPAPDGASAPAGGPGDSATAPAVTAALPPAPPAAPVDPSTGRLALAASLERALDGDQLWATVQVDGDAVEIRSAYCGDPGLAARVDAAAPQLHGAGLRALRCMEPHGGLAFRRDL